VPRTRPDLKAIVLTFLTTGLRISDVIGLSWASVDFDARRIVHRTKKRGTLVNLPLHPELAADLEKFRPRILSAQAPVFATRSGRPLENLDKILAGLFKRCRIEGGHAHRFRDTLAVRMLAQGATLYDVSKVLGISAGVAELYYSPYVKELQERTAGILAAIRHGASEQLENNAARAA
jgi:integrase